MNTTTGPYRLMELAAISGECSTRVLPILGLAPSYSEKLVTRLKGEGLIKTHYRDGLRGYRLTSKGKELLLEENPDRFSFYLSGSSDTNHPRSDIPRRLRLQQASIAYAMLCNAGVEVFRDRKTRLFQTGNAARAAPFPMPLPAFYHSREVKELGAEAVKVNNSRAMGILLAPECIYALFCTGSAPMKWEYRTELKVKALLSYHASRGILSRGHIEPCYHPDTPIKALLLGEGMDTLRLLCSPTTQTALRNLLLSDLQPPRSGHGLEHDAVSDGKPVLLAFDFDMMRLSRFRTALSFHGLAGSLICFDFQEPVLRQYFGDAAAIETIDLYKFERRFLR